MTSPLIEMKDSVYVYPGGNTALNYITLCVNRNENLGIIGPNGAGKSTLLQLLVGILTSLKGDISIDGIVMKKKNLALLRKKAGLLFQDSDDQLFCPTVGDDIAFGPVNMGLEEEEIGVRVGQALEAVGIGHLKDRPPYTLSGGEKKAAALASLLSMRPEILLMDEPSANLDPRSRRGLIRIIKSLTQTKIIVSHDLDFIWETCDRVIILNKGRIASEGSTGDILSDRELLEKNDLELPLRFQGCPLCGTGRPTVG